MATLDELYQKVLASEEERTAFAKAAADEQAIAEFLAQRGCDATPQEARAFLEGKFSQTGELANEELAGASGGGICGNDPNPSCPKCGSANTDAVSGESMTYTCRACGNKFTYRPSTVYPPF